LQDIAKTAVTFAFPLPTPPSAHLVSGGAPIPECPGDVVTPSAAPGRLCVYVGGSFSDAGVTFSDPTAQGGSATTRQGFVLTGTPIAGTGFGYAIWGTWAVTAP
jgi:hypothetical protein